MESHAKSYKEASQTQRDIKFFVSHACVHNDQEARVFWNPKKYL